LTNLEEMRKTHAGEIEKLGPNADKITDLAVLSRLMPPIAKMGGGKIAVGEEAGIPPQLLVAFDRRRSLAEGIAGTAPAQICPHQDCSWHALRACSALTTAPANAATCTVRAQLDETVRQPLFKILSRRGTAP
jgi:hypothetical protein